MQQQSSFRLILGSKTFLIPSYFPSLINVNPFIYHSLITNQQYEVKSNVNENVLQSFINHWVFMKTPNIRIDNLNEFDILSQEFDRMKDIVQIFKKLTLRIKKSYLLTKNQKLCKKISKKGDFLNAKVNTFHQIIHFLFTNKGITSYTHFLELRTKLLDACQKESVKDVDYLTRTQFVDEKGYLYVLNKEEKTCDLYDILSSKDFIIVPRSINYQSQEFIVTSILKCNIKSIFMFSMQFEENSELKTIEENAFSHSYINQISVPPSVTKIGKGAFSITHYLDKVDLSQNSQIRCIERNLFKASSINHLLIRSSVSDFEEGWCESTFNLKNITIVPCEEKNIIYYDDMYILGKSQKESDIYDVLIFARRDIKIAEIPSFIKEIKPYAFHCCSLLTKVVFKIDSELEIIGKYSFTGTSITKMIIPPKVTEIGSYCFHDCQKLQLIVCAPQSQLKKICSNAFSTYSIENVYIPSSVVEFEDNWCNEATSLNITIIPNDDINIINVDSLIIGKSDLSSNNFDTILFAQRYITTAKIPSFIKIISKQAFTGCILMKEIEIPSNSELELIDEKAFKETQFERIFIPANVTQINKSSFANCIYLKSIEFAENSKLQYIDKYAFENSSIEEFFIPSNVTELNKKWCKRISNLTKIKIAPNNKNFMYLNDTFLIGKSDPKSDEYDNLLFIRRDVQEAKVPSFIKRISSFAFNSNQLKSVNFADNSELMFIDSYAFYESSITSICIPCHVKEISEKAFLECIKLLKIEFETNSELKIIGKSSFNQCFISHKEISLFDKYLMMANKTFGNINASSDNEEELNDPSSDFVFIPSHVTKIDSEAFSKCTHLQKVEFADNSELNELGEHSFAETSIKSIIIPSHVTHIGQYSFKKCIKLQEVVFQINSELRTIGNNAFCQSLIKKITIPSSVVVIENNAFNKCQNLDIVEFAKNSNLKIIGQKAFSNTSIRKIEIPSSVVEIQSQAFEGCKNLIEVEFLMDSNLIFLHPSAFAFSTIQSIILPSKTVKFDDGLFIDTKNLSNIAILPSEEQNIIYYENKYILGKSQQENEIYDVLIFANRSIVHAEIPSFIKEIKPYAFNMSPHLTKVDFHEGSELEIIGENSFSNTNIKRIIIPPKVAIIKFQSFYRCQSLRLVEFADNSQLKQICYCAFQMTHIHKILIPPHVTHIFSQAFYECRFLQNVDFTDDSELQFLGRSAFTVENKFTSFKIPPHVTYIDDSCFIRCTNLKIVEFHENSDLASESRDAPTNINLNSIFVMIPVKLKGKLKFSSKIIL